MNAGKRSIEQAWDTANPKAIHPTRNISEKAYWKSGEEQADVILAELPTDGRVLDYGCGDGRVLKPLRASGVDVHGADTSRAMLSRLGDFPAQLITGAIDGEFEAVYALAILIHHDSQGQNEIVANIARCLVVGGVALLDWPTGPRHERISWIDVTVRVREERNAYAASVGLDYDRESTLGSIFVKGTNA